MKLLINDKLIHDNVKLIIFDKDGTLIDIHHYWYSMIVLRANKLVETYNLKTESISHLIKIMGGDINTKKLFPDGPIGVKPREFIVEKCFQYISTYSSNSSEKKVEQVFQAVDKESLKTLTSFLKILPGVIEFLNKAKKLNIDMAIGTTDLTERAILALKLLNINHFFKFIVGGDLVKNKKPAPDMGEYILNSSQCSPTNTIMIGDHTVDMNMGSACNMTSIGVCTGLSSETNLKAATEHVIQKFSNMDITND